MSNLNKHKCYKLIKKLIEPTQEAKKVCTHVISLVKDSELREYSKLMLSLGNNWAKSKRNKS